MPIVDKALFPSVFFDTFSLLDNCCWEVSSIDAGHFGLTPCCRAGQWTAGTITKCAGVGNGGVGSAPFCFGRLICLREDEEGCPHNVPHVTVKRVCSACVVSVLVVCF